jgi:uncharacterized membrane protein YfcA
MTFVVIAIAVLVAALVQGTVGLGYALIVAPILSVADPDLVPATVISAGLALSLLMARREHAAVDLRGIRWLAVGLLPGTVLGAALLAMASARALQLLVAGAVLVGVVLSAIRPVAAAGRTTLFGAGVVSGIFGTTASIAGPPVAMVYADRSAATFRATLAVFFLLSGALSFMGALMAGAVSWRALLWSTALLPSVVAGFAISKPFARRVEGGSVRVSVLVVSAAAAVVLLVRAV